MFVNFSFLAKSGKGERGESGLRREIQNSSAEEARDYMDRDNC